jgi:hypothetical protein
MAFVMAMLGLIRAVLPGGQVVSTLQAPNRPSTCFQSSDGLLA